MQKNRLLKIFLIVFLSFFLALWGSFYVVLNGEWFWKKVIESVQKGQGPYPVVDNVHVEKAKSSFLGDIELTNLSLQVHGPNDMYDLKVSSLHIGLKTLINLNPHIDIKAVSMNLKSDIASFEGATASVQVSADKSKPQVFEGELKISQASSKKYEATEINIQFHGDKNKVILKNINGKLYQGSLSGAGEVVYKPSLQYDVQLKFNHVRLALMREASEVIFDSLRGVSDGEIKVQGGTRGLAFIKMYVNIPEEGQIKANLLAPLIAHIPKNSQQRKDLELLMKVNGFVLLDTAELNLESISRDQLRSALHLESNRFDLSVKLSTDINLDGNLNRLIENFQTIMSLTGGGS